MQTKLFTILLIIKSYTSTSWCGRAYHPTVSCTSTPMWDSFTTDINYKNKQINCILQTRTVTEKKTNETRACHQQCGPSASLEGSPILWALVWWPPTGNRFAGTSYEARHFRGKSDKKNYPPWARTCNDTLDPGNFRIARGRTGNLFAYAARGLLENE